MLRVQGASCSDSKHPAGRVVLYTDLRTHSVRPRRPRGASGVLYVFGNRGAI